MREFIYLLKRIKIMKYPKWLPYPKAWGQAIVLMFTSLIVFGGVIFVIQKINPDLIEAILYIVNDIARSMSVDPNAPPRPVPTSTQIIAVFFTALGLPSLIIIYLLSLIQQILWDDPVKGFPVWFPRWRCWGEGIWGFCVTIFSIITASLLDWIYWHDTESYFDYMPQDETLGGFFYIITLAYCFHFRNLIFRKYQKKEEPKSAKNIDPIEQELNGIKGDFGIKKMNDINKRD
jgi:hypothetical protein